MPELPDDVRGLFEGPNYAHIATVLPDGGPHTVPVWVGMHDRRVVFFSTETTRKARNLDADPRVALSLIAHDNPYRFATVRGRVVGRIHGTEADAIVDGISHRYTGKPFDYRGMTVFLIEPEHWATQTLDYEHTPPS